MNNIVWVFDFCYDVRFQPTWLADFFDSKMNAQPLDTDHLLYSIAYLNVAIKEKLYSEGFFISQTGIVWFTQFSHSEKAELSQQSKKQF